MMSQTTQKLDSQFTKGVWRDMHCGDFLEIEESEDGDVNLIHPDTGTCYHTIGLEDWNKWQSADFSRVPSGAVSDPVFYIQEAVQVIINNDINELSSITQEWVNGVAYAQQNVNLEELLDTY